MKKLTYVIGLAGATLALISCEGGLAPVRDDALQPVAVTQVTPHDADDPVIWIHPNDPSKRIILGTDKDSDGGLYAYDLEGAIVNKVTGLNRPNKIGRAHV